MLTPVSPAEVEFLNWLPIIAKIVSVFTGLGGVILFLLAYRLGRKSGYLVLAVAALLSMVTLQVSLSARLEGQDHATPADAQFAPAKPAMVTRAPVDIPLVEMVVCWGALLLYRAERRKARGAVGSGPGDRSDPPGPPLDS